MVAGTPHAGDPFAMHAQGDLTAAYNDAAGRQPPQALPADVGGRTLAPGVYKTGATPALGLTGALTLDAQGDPNAVFIFQVGSALTTSVASRVNLIGGAQSCNVFWQIGSSATLGTSSVFAGSILALSSISMNDGVTLNGRALARNGAVTLINDTINAAHCTTATTPGGTTGGPTIPGGTTGGDTRAPAAPVLVSPRTHERVYAGNVNFRWRRSARAERYTLMVDHHRINTGPQTSATMRVRPGAHNFRVIAQNRYGARSSRHGPFRAKAAGFLDPDLIASVAWVKTDASSKRYPNLKGWTLSVTPRNICRATCFTPPERHAAWDQVKKAVKAIANKAQPRPGTPGGPPSVLSQSMYDQFACHGVVAQFKSKWNLDTYRPDASLAGEVKHGCNPPDGSALKTIEGRL